MEEVAGGCAGTLQDLDRRTINGASLKKINDVGIREGDRIHYTRNHWARGTTETPAKIREQQIPCIALMDHGLEINLMSSYFYAQGRWSIIHGGFRQYERRCECWSTTILWI